MSHGSRIAPSVSHHGICVLASLLAAMVVSCGEDEGPPIVPVPPVTRALPEGVVVPDTLTPGEVVYWRADVTPGVWYVVAIVGLTDKIALLSYGGDGLFRNAENCFTTSPDTTLAKQCAYQPVSTAWFIEVEGSRVTSPEALYAIVLLPALMTGTPVAEVADVQADIPYAGQVATRSSSVYHARGLTPGVEHRVNLIGLTGSVEMRAPGCPGPTLDYPTECGAGFDSTATISVTSGPINRDGARYYVLVR